MTDTSEEIITKQREIFYSKTTTERFKICEDLINLGNLMLKNSIRKKTPLISETELQIKIFKRFYKDSFTKNELNKIIVAMREFLNKKNIKPKSTV